MKIGENVIPLYRLIRFNSRTRKKACWHKRALNAHFSLNRAALRANKYLTVYPFLMDELT